VKENEFKGGRMLMNDTPLFDGGMTLRDYFAAQAISGLYACEWWAQDKEITLEMTAKGAYMFADAMLKERMNFE
jgi:hypothetical protein